MNILFIGMPGAGKTTICSLLSKKMNKIFIEIDEIIESQLNMKLQTYMDRYGNESFKEKEGEIILQILKTTKNGIISPPGSIIYYPKVIDYLKNNKDYLIIYLECSLENILKRTNHFKDRGVVMNMNKKDPYLTLYNERVPYYESLCTLKVNSEQDISILVKKIEDIIK